jgi:hypothetical protein
VTAKRLLAILFIFVCTAVAWFALGASVVHRTERSVIELSQHVSQLWGGRHAQVAPSAWYWRSRVATKQVQENDVNGNRVTREVREESRERVPVPLASSRIDVDLALDHRRKGLLWHDTYTVAFAGRYEVRVPEEASTPVHLHFTFPSPKAIYDDFLLAVNGIAAPHVDDLSQGISVESPAGAGEVTVLEISYRSRGLDTWKYLFTAAGVAQTQDFALTLVTDFDDIDFLTDTLSPSARERLDGGWRLDWKFANLVSGQSIGIDLPNKLNPGPLTARITFFAPVSLLFFLTVLVILGALRHLSLHPMHYFFLSAAFFSFHLLLAYLVDHLDIHAAFILAALTSIGLVVSYLRMVCGLRRALAFAGLTQLVFLVLFSYAFFFEGYTGLTITLGAVLTLFLLMQLTGRFDWDEVFRPDTTPPARIPGPGWLS